MAHPNAVKELTLAPPLPQLAAPLAPATTINYLELLPQHLLFLFQFTRYQLSLSSVALYSRIIMYEMLMLLMLLLLLLLHATRTHRNYIS